ncbi:BadF/BadG/BcrA/BcrD ATPase family protein [Simiduia agarivorans]|uniref:BadF/BadG/BcrA/BcrD type ATPase n=1 Tax=Simiduia agarivorans (strain DSM 21679 / JCM 13881 / BCRC 17597 / SA1) TaxID=1117647 RepID=K4KKY2_SIMAS|nr:BadF/BadG/BcrA/BcrD ATPase family protein [Simiduia agarivorans]AFU98698.1 BadF/BadG/BcrA/BcrD type ATPase [Simiduia agarivorans SA1 = DSM 21679]
MSQTILGIDAGGTKTIGRIEVDGVVLAERKAGPGNIASHPEAAVANIGSLVAELAHQTDVPLDTIHLVCGAAGAGSQQATRRLSHYLGNLGLASARVTSDAYTSLIGASQGEPCIMLAIGTGSVAMRLDRAGQVRQFGGWGLAIGDEGSGATMGKAAVRALLWELDVHGEARNPLTHAVRNLVGEQRDAILGWLSKAGPREYAALAPTVLELGHHCEEARKVLDKTIAEVNQLLEAASGDEDLPLTLQGGLAQHLQHLLPAAVQQRLVPARGTALDGACLIAREPQRFN